MDRNSGGAGYRIVSSVLLVREVHHDVARLPKHAPGAAENLPKGEQPIDFH
jgi:hypothetical protein